MARPISDEELQLKRRARRRLIGAIVLVTAIVVALPMVLDSEPKPISGEVSIKIPATDSGAFTSRVVPVAPDREPKSTPSTRPSTELKSPPKTAAVPSEKKTAPSTAVPAPAEKKAAAPAPAPAPSTVAAAPKAALPAGTEAPGKTAQTAPENPAAAKPMSQTFAVQVVALADVDKVKQVQAQVAAAGIKSYTEVVKTVKGDVTRVRAGPYTTRAAAEKARDQLKAIGLNGNVVPK